MGALNSKKAYPWKVSSFGMYVEFTGVGRNRVDDAMAEPLNFRHRTG
jgi:hypothetical protein